MHIFQSGVLGNKYHELSMLTGVCLGVLHTSACRKLEVLGVSAARHENQDSGRPNQVIKSHVCEEAVTTVGSGFQSAMWRLYPMNRWDLRVIEIRKSESTCCAICGEDRTLN